MKVFGVILWIWFAIAVCVYLWRFVQWIGRRNDPDAERKPSRKQRRETQLQQMQAAASGPSPTEQLFQQAAADRAAGRAPGESTSASALPVAQSGATEPRATIAELLTGMDWPCELAPVIDTAATDLDRRVVFSTTARPAEVVLPALREGLEAIGYELVERDQWRFTGIGDRGRLGIVVHPDANAVAGQGGAPLSATMPPGSVAVELTSLD